MNKGASFSLSRGECLSNLPPDVVTHVCTITLPYHKPIPIAMQSQNVVKTETETPLIVHSVKEQHIPRPVIYRIIIGVILFDDRNPFWFL
jgi:hypothetical protein